MTFYLCARYARRDELRAYAAALTAAGHVVRARWLDEQHALDYQPSAAESVAMARTSRADIMNCDVVIAFTEDPSAVIPGASRGGRHHEFGFADAAGKRLVVIGPRENIFHHGERVEDQFNNWKACLAAIKRGEIA